MTTIARLDRRHDARDRPEADDPLDAALVRARGGDDSGFLDLWHALQPRLLRYLRVAAPAAAEDVAADTWLAVVRDLRGFTGNAAAFRAWLFTVARHRAVDAARARAARPAVLHPEPHRLPTTPTAGSAEHDALERLSTQEALRLVASLPAEQAEMVALRVIGGLDVAAVAAIVGKSPGAVRVAVHRGLRALSRHPAVLAREDDNDETVGVI